jgi:uncharacterized protein
MGAGRAVGRDDVMRKPALAVIAGLLVVGAASSSGAAQAASFACARAKAPDERAICADPALSNLDSRLAGLLDLDEGAVAMGQRGDMQDAQAAWLKTRAACGANRACLHARYETRLKQVSDHLTQRLCGQDGPPC